MLKTLPVLTLEDRSSDGKQEEQTKLKKGKDKKTSHPLRAWEKDQFQPVT